jgi:hypothetical protein
VIAEQAAEYLRAQAAAPEPAAKADRSALEDIAAAKAAAVPPTAEYLAAKAALAKRSPKGTKP